jgi:hypothetical protein
MPKSTVPRRRVRQLPTNSSPDEDTGANLSKRAGSSSSADTPNSDLADVLKNFVVSLKSQVATVSPRPITSTGLLPPFNPEDRSLNIHQWVAKVEELASMYRWTEEVTVNNALAKLEGLAKTWLSGLPTVTYTWEEWRGLLIAAFPTSDDYHQKLQTVVQRAKKVEETYLRYYYEKLALLNQCGINGEEAVSCLIGGIQNVVIKTGARAGGYTDPSTLLGYLRGCDAASSAASQTADDHRQKLRRGAPVQEEPRTRRVRCHKCKELGHIKPNCPLSRNKGGCNDKRTRTSGKILRPITDGSYPISIGSMTGRPSQLEAYGKLPKTTDVIRCFVTKFMACQVSGCKRPQIDMCESMSSGVHNYFSDV